MSMDAVTPVITYIPKLTSYDSTIHSPLLPYIFWAQNWVVGVLFIWFFDHINSLISFIIKKYIYLSFGNRFTRVKGILNVKMGEKSKSLITQENFLIFLLKILKMEICRKKRPLLIWKMEYSSKSIIFFTFHIKYILENIPFKYHFFFFLQS